MSHTPFNLGFFASFGPPSWQASEDRLNGGDWWTGEYLVSVAKRLEQAKVDFLFFEDTSVVSSSVGGTMDADLRYNIYSPKGDPLQLLPRLAGETEHLGLIATASTTFYPPYILARLFSTLDSMSGGRAGWNIVTTADAEAAQNYGMDELPPHDVRYDMADEYIDVVKKLWASWEPDALIRDVENNSYVDPSKVHHIDHDGTYYKVRGPLNTLPSPQGHPLLVQAGSSPRGRDFAAKNAELIFAPAEGGLEGMKAFRDDIRERAVQQGRDADDIKIIYAAFVSFLPDGVDPSEPQPVTEAQFEYQLAFMSATLDIDLSQFPLDEPFPADLEPRGHTGMFVALQEMGKEGLSLREGILSFRAGSGTDFAGTPEVVAQKMADAIDFIGGDGFMIISSNILTAQFLDNVTDGLIPALQRAGAIRTEYPAAPTTLRETLRRIEILEPTTH